MGTNRYTMESRDEIRRIENLHPDDHPTGAVDKPCNGPSHRRYRLAVSATAAVIPK